MNFQILLQVVEWLEYHIVEIALVIISLLALIYHKAIGNFISKTWGGKDGLDAKEITSLVLLVLVVTIVVEQTRTIERLTERLMQVSCDDLIKIKMADYFTVQVFPSEYFYALLLALCTSVGISTYAVLQGKFGGKSGVSEETETTIKKTKVDVVDIPKQGEQP